MKRFLTFFIIFIVFIMPAFSAADKTSEDYLKGGIHPGNMSFFAEHVVKTALKHSLKKEIPGKYKVKFKGYTLSSIKKGIFKYLEITGKNVTVNEIEIPYFNLKTITDYNWIDYNQNPVVFKSDMKFDYIMHLSEQSINKALETEDYNKILRNINKKAFPIFTLTNVMVKIKNDKLYIIMSYNFPLAPKAKDRTFMVTGKLKVVNNEIMPYDVAFDSVYGNLPIKKVVNLVNLLNPLNFTVKLIDDKKGNCKIEEIKIVDDIVVINGKIYVEGEK